MNEKSFDLHEIKNICNLIEKYEKEMNKDII
jgi:hypothetical protein